MRDEYSIILQNVGIVFRRDRGRTSLRELVNSFSSEVFSRGKSDKSLKKEYFWGLKGVNLDIRRGETVGIIGDNGSGKSTLLKIISGIYPPDEGRVEVKGKITSLLELGAGFHEELSGRDNVYLYGTILGMKISEVERVYDSIVSFAELEKFMNMPLKRYSSGMKVRLGFSVAVHLEPDILLLDEILSVGDARFRQKSLHAMRKKKEEGVTILLVSHNLHYIQSFCHRAILIHGGRVVRDGKPGEVIDEYIARTFETSEWGRNTERGTGDVRIENVRFLDGKKRVKKTFRSDEPFVVELEARMMSSLQNPVFGIGVYNQENIRIFGTNTLKEGINTGAFREGDVCKVRFEFDRLSLSEGPYFISLTSHSPDGSVDYHWIEKGFQIYVENLKGFSGIFDLCPQVEVER